MMRFHEYVKLRESGYDEPGNDPGFNQVGRCKACAKETYVNEDDYCKQCAAKAVPQPPSQVKTDGSSLS